MGKRKSLSPDKMLFPARRACSLKCKGRKASGCISGRSHSTSRRAFCNGVHPHHPLRNRRSNKTFPETEFHTVVCVVVFEIPGKWRRENGIRLLRVCPFFGSLLWASKEMNRNMLAWQVSHFQNCADA